MTVPSWPSPYRVPVVAASLARYASPSAPSLRLDVRHEFRRLLPQAAVGHAPASGHVVVRKPPGCLAHFFREALVPVGARVRRGEQLLHDRPFLLVEAGPGPRAHRGLPAPRRAPARAGAGVE